MVDRKMNGGFYYNNILWLSPAYQALTKSSRNLLHCLATELRWARKGKKNTYLNNGTLSFTEIDFKERFGSCSATYLKARNQLIEIGFIKQTHRGGHCRGDMSRYKILISNDVPEKHMRWLRYPQENWASDIPKVKCQIVGKETQWKKGKCARKTKATL